MKSTHTYAVNKRRIVFYTLMCSFQFPPCNFLAWQPAIEMVLLFSNKIKRKVKWKWETNIQKEIEALFLRMWKKRVFPLVSHMNGKTNGMLSWNLKMDEYFFIGWIFVFSFSFGSFLAIILYAIQFRKKSVANDKEASSPISFQWNFYSCHFLHNRPQYFGTKIYRSNIEVETIKREWNKKKNS